MVSIFETAFQANLPYGIIGFSQHLFGPAQPLPDDELYRANAIFPFEKTEKAGAAHAGLAAKQAYTQVATQVVPNVLNDVLEWVQYGCDNGRTRQRLRLCQPHY